MTTILRFILFFLLAPAFAIVAQAAGAVQGGFRVVDADILAESVILKGFDGGICGYDSSGALLQQRSIRDGKACEEGDSRGCGEPKSAGAAQPLFPFLAQFEAANNASRTNFNQYEAIFEAPITGTSRSVHRNSANSFFANQLENSSDLQRAVNNEFGTDVLQHMNSGSGLNLLNPPGTQWHHPIDNPNVMQLLRKGEHTNPMLEPILHPGPNGTGGFGTFF